MFIYAKRNRFQTAPALLGNGNLFSPELVIRRAEVANHRLWELKATNQSAPYQLFNYSVDVQQIFQRPFRIILDKLRETNSWSHLAREILNARKNINSRQTSPPSGERYNHVPISYIIVYREKEIYFFFKLEKSSFTKRTVKKKMSRNVIRINERTNGIC